MPSPSQFSESFTDHFIYYLPKDVVAADFHWLLEKEGQVFFAVADCTGHGVPGALVSMASTSALHQAVNVLDLLEPSKILDVTKDLLIGSF